MLIHDSVSLNCEYLLVHYSLFTTPVYSIMYNTYCAKNDEWQWMVYSTMLLANICSSSWVMTIEYSHVKKNKLLLLINSLNICRISAFIMFLHFSLSPMERMAAFVYSAIYVCIVLSKVTTIIHLFISLYSITVFSVSLITSRSHAALLDYNYLS